MNDKTSNQTSPSTEITTPEKPSGTDQRKQEAKLRPRKQKAGSKSGSLALLLSLITLAGIGGAGWYGYQTIWPEVASQIWVNQKLSSTQAFVASELAQMSRSVNSRTTEIDGQSQRLVTRLDNLDVRFNRLQAADRNDWKLAEAEYLMRLANQRLLTMHDLKSAHTLLAQADELLVAVDEYGLFGVRAALAEDIAAIRATSEVDIDKAWLELNAISSRIEQLATLSYQKPESTTEVKAPESAQNQPQTWQDQITEAAEYIWNAFAGQFRIRETGKTVVPELLAPEQEMYLRQNLKLMLEQAQTALLQGRADIYRTCLLNARKWLDKWFLNNGQEMQALQESLAALAGSEVEQQIPDISRSLTTLKAYINDKASQRLPVEAVEQESENNSDNNDEDQ